MFVTFSKRYAYLLVLAGVLSAASGCGMFKDKNSSMRNRGKDYLRSGKVEEMNLPEGMQAPAVSPWAAKSRSTLPRPSSRF